VMGVVMCGLVLNNAASFHRRLALFTLATLGLCLF
jgi:hypothetical protein